MMSTCNWDFVSRLLSWSYVSVPLKVSYPLQHLPSTHFRLDPCTEAQVALTKPTQHHPIFAHNLKPILPLRNCLFVSFCGDKEPIKFNITIGPQVPQSYPLGNAPPPQRALLDVTIRF